MLLPNQVTPTGTLVSAPGTRGLLMGNRGILEARHYAMPQPAASSRPWIACVLKDKNGLPIPPSPVKYTKLFLLDEVTAFAAGHRPCGQCQKKRYMLFVDAWCTANRKPNDVMDSVLHSERCRHETGEIASVATSALNNLPNGTMVRLDDHGQPHLLLWGRLFPWTVAGYGTPLKISPSTLVQVLTPNSIVKAFQAGFPLLLNSETTVHPSVLDHS